MTFPVLVRVWEIQGLVNARPSNVNRTNRGVLTDLINKGLNEKWNEY